VAAGPNRYIAQPSTIHLVLSWISSYPLSALAVCEKTLFACEPIKRMVPTTITRITASITAYSAISWPSSFDQTFWRSSFMLSSFQTPTPEDGEIGTRLQLCAKA
jgi:hypothetical protein